MLYSQKTLFIVFLLTLIIGSIGLYFSRGSTYNLTAIDLSEIPEHSNLEQRQEYNYTNEDKKVNKSRTSLDDKVPPKKMLPIERKITRTELPINIFNSSGSRAICRDYDIMNMKAIQFDSTYKNPCWKGANTNGTWPNNIIHCLPYYFLIDGDVPRATSYGGVKKCGTTDFYSRIQYHPQICYPGFKESQWLPRLRFGIEAFVLELSTVQDLLRAGNDVRSVSFYASMFDKAATCIQSQADHSGYHSFITGDGTPALLHMHTNWKMLPGNEGLDEPKYTNFHYINHINPHAKIIILFRDPVSRLYSDFFMYMKETKLDNKNKLFHNHVTKLMAAYNKCFDDNTLRQCIYNNTLQQSLIQDGIKLGESFHAGFYAFFMKELLSVFRRDQLLPILTLDYLNDMRVTLQKTFKFLGLEQLDEKKMEDIIGKKIPNSHKERRNENMLEETKSLLKQFYKPYNAEMAKLMDDKRYLFEEY